MLDASRLKRAETIFQDLIILPVQKRREFWNTRSDDDHDVRELVERLLAHDDSGMTGFLCGPALAPPAEKDAATDGEPVTDRTSLTPVLKHGAAAPAHIADFQIIRRISEGGMGVVYEALQDNPRRTVALKVIRGGRFIDEYTLRLFQRETEALARLRHPCVGAIYEAGRTEDGQHFFAMEFVHGRALDKYVREKGVGLRDRLALFRRICEAINYAHQRGVLHRDLKPSNILIDEDAHPRILDFGLARIADANLGIFTSETMTGRIQGTLAYMSPEQARGNPDEIDTRSDVYSLGIILYELIADALPYEVSGLPLPEAVGIICSQAPRRLRNAAPRPGFNVGADLETIAIKALEKEPSRRYASAAALAEDIERYLTNQPILARPASSLYHVRKFVRRYRVPAALAGALFLAITALAITSTLQANRLSRRQEQVLNAEGRATRRFDQVRHLASSFLFDFHDAIVNLPGSTAARQMLVTTALEYLDGLSKEAANDPDLLFELARAYQRVGQVQHSVRTGNLGDSRGARASQQRALAILEPLRQQFPDNVAYQEHCALGRQYLAEIDLNAPDREANFTAAFADFESLTERFPDDLRYTKRLYTAHLGKAYGLTTNQHYPPEMAMKHLQKTRQLIERVLQAEPDNIDVLADLARYHDFMGDLLGSRFLKHQFSDNAKALEEYERALALQRELAARKPDDAVLQRGVIWRLGKTASPLAALGRMDEALDRTRQVVQGARAFAAADPNDALVREDLKAMLQRLGDLSSGAGRLDEAITAYQDAFDVAQGLLAREPGNSKHTMSLGTLAQQLSTLYAKQSDWPMAVRWCSKAMDAWASPVVIAQLEPEFHRTLVEAVVSRMASAHLAAGDPAQAIASYQRAVDLFRQALSIEHSGPDWQHRRHIVLARGCERLGDFLVSSEIDSASAASERDARVSAACHAFQQALAALEDLLVATEPLDQSRVESRARLERKVGDCQTRQQ